MKAKKANFGENRKKPDFNGEEENREIWGHYNKVKCSRLSRKKAVN